MNHFIFDVDGTLTPSRQKMDKNFKKYFLELCRNNNMYLVTGSDYPKTVEQVGEDVCNSVTRVYNCSGCEVREKGNITRSIAWDPKESLINFLNEELAKSRYFKKTGNHIEVRQGMLNFSIVGRSCNLEDRHLYREWDEHKNERELIAKRFNKKFPDIEAKVAGETGIDIAPKGMDKSQILVDFNKKDKLYFFGDRMDLEGNDYPLAMKNKNGQNINVNSWYETYDKLRLLKVMGICK